jgi:hypothetical protein
VVDYPLVGVVGLIGYERVCLHIRQKMIGADKVMGLSAGQVEPGGISQAVDKGMDLGA